MTWMNWKRLRLLHIHGAAGLVACVASAAAHDMPADPLRYADDTFDIKLGLDAAVQGTVESNSWWNLTNAIPPPAPYDPDMSWAEGYIKPSVVLKVTPDKDWLIYGGLAAIASRTWNRDIFDESDTGAVLLENAYGGVRVSLAPDMAVDLSGGQQNYAIGSGMLIQNGAGNGFERGAPLLAPRTAWEMTAIARETIGNLVLEQFYLDPNELDSGESFTELAGAHARLEWTQNDYVGLSYINVLNSEYPSVQAPLVIIPDGRDGMNVVHAYFRTQPISAYPTLWIAGELAHEWNDRIDQSAWGGQAEIGYTAANLPFMPTFSYAFRYFSGDDPDTEENERFDALYYNGTPISWATGANASLTFYNSNVMAHRIGVDFVLSEQDFLKARYWHVRAAEENSPIQFGQGAYLDFSGSIPILQVGVQDAHLSDDFYLEYTRILTPNLFVTGGTGFSIPGKGLKDLARGEADNWWGAYITLTAKY